MRLDIWVSLAVLLSAIFFALGYALNIGRAEETEPQYTYIDIIYFFGSLFFLAYATLTFYQSIKYPRADELSLSGAVHKFVQKYL